MTAKAKAAGSMLCGIEPPLQATTGESAFIKAGLALRDRAGFVVDGVPRTLL
jgi:hypothetical protein